MIKKELVKKHENETETAISPFVIFQTSVSEIRDAASTNLGDDGVNARDFEGITIPPGGGTSWALQNLDGEELVKELEGIILHWRDTRGYWSVPMEKSEGNMPPDCYSWDARSGIGKPGGDCSKCAFSQFGSDTKGEGQACKLVRQLSFVRPGNLLPEIVRLPATSVKPARQYFMRLASKGVPCYGIVTKVGLEKTRNAQGIVYSKATFTSGGRLTPEQTARVKEYAAMLRPFLECVPSAPVATDTHNTEGEVI